MTADDPSTTLDASTALIVASGPTGAHLSVVAPQWRSDSCRGLAQAVGDDGEPAPRPLTPQTAHDLGSVTKIAGTTAMLIALAGRGDIGLADPMRRFVPGFPCDVTLEDVLRHRAGLWEWWPTYLPDAWPGHQIPEDVIAGICSLPLRYQSGTERHYSDLGFMTLGRVIEIVTSGPLSRAHADLIACPLGLRNMRYGSVLPGVQVAASSRGDWIEKRMVETGRPYPVDGAGSEYSGWREHVLVGEVNDGNAYHSFGGMAGHAGLFSTAEDLHVLGSEFLVSLRGEGRWSALPLFVGRGPDSGQLIGFRSWDSSADGCMAQVIGHTGFPGIGFGFIPEHRATVVLATNRLHVIGEPAVFDPLWRTAIDAAHNAIHAAGCERFD